MKELPNAPEAERAVLGTVLREPEAAMADCMAVLPDAEAFYDGRHKTVYEAMLKLADLGEPISVVSVVEKLKMENALDQVGGYGFLSELPDHSAGAMTLGYYTAIVKARWQQRRMFNTLRSSAQSILECGDNVSECLDAIENQVLEVNRGGAASRCKRVHEVLEEVVPSLEKDAYRRGRGLLSGLPTGFGYFDKMTGGLQRSEFVVLAGRPSTGKTSLAMNIAENVGVNGKNPVGVFSLEMQSSDVVLRMMCGRAGVDFHQVRTGFMKDLDRAKLVEIVGGIARAPIFIDDTPALEIAQLRARARRMVQQHGIRLLIIDYLQLIVCRDGNSQTERVTKISNGIQALARELKIPVLCLSQMSRDSEKESHRKPRLSDLRDSGAIEQDADAVVLLYRVKLPKEDQEDLDDQLHEYRTALTEGRTPRLPDAVPVNLLIAKQRNGPCGDAKLKFQRILMRFEDAYENRGREAKPAKPRTKPSMPSNDELGM